MTLGYVARRFGTFLVVVWLALTVNFILPRVATPEVSRPRGQTASQLRLDQPLPQQYLSYLGDLARFDLSYSLSSYPTRVADVIGAALPWTIVLLGTTSSIAWLLGTLLGAALAWPGGSDEWGDKASTADPHGQSLRSSSAAMRLVLRAFGRTLGRPKFVQFVFPPLMLLSAAPYFITAMLLLYLLAFKLRLFPQGGGYEAGTFPDISPTFALNLVQHAVLPALSIVLASIATWAIGMRALVVSLKDEDYMLLAEAKGLKRPTIFVRYAIRNAVLPQVTGLGLALGQIVSGALLVEAVFRYPGLGGLLLRAIITRDYVLEQGIVLIIIVSIAMVTLVLDLTYPILDPRLAARARSS